MNRRTLLPLSAVLLLHIAICGVVRGVPLDTNLLLNPKAEEGPASATGEAVSSVPGWTTTGPFTVVTYDAPDGSTGYPKTSDPGPSDRGQQFFAGGASAVATNTSSATQEIDVSANAMDINNNGIGYEVSAYLGGYGPQSDDARVTLTFSNGSGTILGTTTIGPVTKADRDPDGSGPKTAVTGMALRTRNGQVPVGTTVIRVELIMTKVAGGGGIDGYADNLVVKLMPSVVTTLEVTTASDAGAGSLREAVAYASSHAGVFEIHFAAGLGTITLTSGQVVINRDMKIVGPGARTLIIKGANSRIFQVGLGTEATISALTIRNGVSGSLESATTLGGGGIANYGTLTIVDCMILNNGGGPSSGVNGSGGGIYNSRSGILRAERSLIASNSARGDQVLGGGICNRNIMTLIDCTVASNQVTTSGTGLFPGGYGAGIYTSNDAQPSPMMTLINCTVCDNFFGATASGNIARSGAGISLGSGATGVIINTIVARNILGSDSPDVRGVFQSQGHNLIGNTAGSSGWKTDLNDPDRDFVGTSPALDPQLGVLQDNGGPTDTLALKAVSVGVDNGSDAVLNPPTSLATDQRGFPRNSGAHVDIGAFERGPVQSGPVFTVNNISEHDDGSCSVDDCTLLEALNASNADVDANTINFTPGLTGAIGTSVLTPTGLIISNPVAIEGPGARVLAVTGRTSGRVFRAMSADVSISGMSIVNGKATGGNGGAISNAGGLTLTNCRISSSAAILTTEGGDGGGVHNAVGAYLNVSGCTFDKSSAQRAGGGIHNAGILTVTNSTFSEDGAVQGGAIYSEFADNNSKVSLLNCTVTRCSASDTGTAGGSGGGGLYFRRQRGTVRHREHASRRQYFHYQP